RFMGPPRAKVGKRCGITARPVREGRPDLRASERRGHVNWMDPFVLESGSSVPTCRSCAQPEQCLSQKSKSLRTCELTCARGDQRSRCPPTLLISLATITRRASDCLKLLGIRAV